MLSVSIIVPTYNERDNIPLLCRDIAKTLAGRKFEILIVDDNSPDGTGKAVLTLTKEIPQLRLIARKEKRGIGAALRNGFEEAVCDILLSMDADLSWDCADIARLIYSIENGADMVLGSRHIAGGGYEAPSWRIKLKKMVSTLGNAFVSAVAGTGVGDHSSNFRAIRRKVWNTLDAHDDSDSLLVEMILKAAYGGYDVREIPVAFRDRRYGESKINHIVEVPKVLVTFLYYVLTLRLFGRGRR